MRPVGRGRNIQTRIDGDEEPAVEKPEGEQDGNQDRGLSVKEKSFTLAGGSVVVVVVCEYFCLK